MARKTPHLCAEPNCPNVLLNGPGRCPEHRKGRARSGSDGYGWAWTRIRTAYIAEHPRCNRCGKPAVDVHHRDHRGPLDAGANAWANLESLCRSCHRRETEHAKKRRALDTIAKRARA